MAIDSDPRRIGTVHDSLTRPDPRRHTQQILAWAICWPWSLLWSVCAYNPFCYVIAFIVNEFRSALDEISSGSFRDIEHDLIADTPRDSVAPATVPVNTAQRVAEQPAEPTEAVSPSALQNADVQTDELTEAVPRPGKIVSVPSVGDADAENRDYVWSPPEPARSHRSPHEISWYSDSSGTPEPVMSQTSLRSGLRRQAETGQVDSSTKDPWDFQPPESSRPQSPPQN